MATETTRLILILVILKTCPLPIRMILVRTAESRSSLISSTEGHVLVGFIIHKQRTHDVLSCAQLCLARPNCLSFNFENTKNGVCELNRETSNGYTIMDKNMLFSKKGHSFYQLVNISVSTIAIIRDESTQGVQQINFSCDSPSIPFTLWVPPSTPDN